MRQNWGEELSALKISPPHAAVLRGVAQHPGCSLRALARTLGADPMNVKKYVDELEQRNLIRSSTCPEDRRPRILTLTNTGHKLTCEVDKLIRKQEMRLNSVLGPIERSHFENALLRLEALFSLGLAIETSAPATAPATANRRNQEH